MIDEFQFLNRHIYWDQEKTRHAEGLAGSYLHTAERKHAPLLITGSWVGWLIDDVNKLLSGRFVHAPLKPLPGSVYYGKSDNHRAAVMTRILYPLFESNLQTSGVLTNCTAGTRSRV